MFKGSKRAYEGYCDKCDDFKKGSLKKKRIDIEVKGVALKVDIFELYCDECHELLTSADVERMNDIIIYDAYKAKVGLLTSEEVRNIRQKRYMSQAQMADFLDIGAKDITRYENGAIQTKCIDNMIRMMEDDKAFANMCCVLNKTKYLIERIDWAKMFAADSPLITHSMWKILPNHKPFIFYGDTIDEPDCVDITEGEDYGREKVRAQA